MRLLDILVAATGLFLLLPLFACLAFLILIFDGSPFLYREKRVGRYGHVFEIIKFRTLRRGCSASPSVAAEDDSRIIPVGLWLRRWRLDELPQFYNILMGHMSLIGPRPMPPAHIDHLNEKQRETILSVRPGLTSLTAIHFLAEDAILAGFQNAEAIYLSRLLPAKTAMEIDYITRRTPLTDLQVLTQTLRFLWSKRAREKSARALRSLLKE